ncbi:MAG: hypothetical protein OSA99_08450 [Acidimicrobiales bacterium]|nr:hypothetical protein [Acidimicrobiales bacterium]
MGTLLAAAPFEDFARENSPVLAIVICGILGILVARLITRTITRLVLLALIVMIGLFVVVQRDNITECTQTCECELAGVDTSVPLCNRALPRTGR